MRILIDIGHPAHVHYYKNFIRIMKSRGHEFLVIARKRECIQELLNYEQIKFVNRGVGGSSFLAKIIYMVYADALILYNAIKFKPDTFLSHSSHYTAHISWLLKKPCICTGDSDHIRLNGKILIPYISTLITPDVYKLDYGVKHVKVKSYSELLYLHPKYFSIQKCDELQLKVGQKYFILRFVSWDAFHDGGQNGISFPTRVKLIKYLEKFGRVFISSEKKLPEQFSKYLLPTPSYKLHSVIAGAAMYVGEGATTASEAAVLGIPSVFVNSLSVCYCTEQEERYSLCYNLRDDSKLLSVVKNIINKKDSLEKHQQNRKLMLNEKKDYTKFLVNFISDYPLLKLKCKENIDG